MAQNSLIQIRIDEELKQQADNLFEILGMDTPTAVRMFLAQAIMQHGIPFPVTVQEDFYNSHMLNDAAKRMENKEDVVVKTMVELETLANE